MKRKGMAFLMAVCMAFSLLPAVKAKEAYIGRIQLPYAGAINFTSLQELADYVYEHMENEDFTIDMLADWNENVRLRIPEDCHATLNMHGHIYNRGLTDYTSDGEVIWVGDDAVLTINGRSDGDAYIDHRVGVYHSWSRDGKADQYRTITGGVIAGGYSSNGGGGIDVKSNVTLNLNEVTIAGNRAEQNWGTDGYGGGIWVHGGINSAGSIYMYQSTITGNYAYNDGGGIYQSNHDGFYLEMDQSHIDFNYCYDQGGGICVDGESAVIKGDGVSSVSGNRTAGGSSHDGGGIYIWNDDVSVSGLQISNNMAYDGGGIYCQEEKVAVSDCTLEGNYAFNKGGGIYVNNDETSITGCEITRNDANSDGNGVYVAGNVDEAFDIIGGTVIADNGSTNLYVENSSRVNFTLTGGANVYMRYAEMPSDYKMVTEGEVGDTVKTTNCIRFLHSDVNGYHFTFNTAPNQRKIYLVKDTYTGSEVGDSYIPGNPTVISAQEASVQARTPVERYTITGSHDGAVRTYPLYRGYFRYPSTEDADANNTGVYYYSDGYFDADPEVYNEHLATMSTAMAMAGMYLQNMDYPYKHASIRQLFTDIGAAEEDVYVNEFNTQKPGTDTIGVAIASKALKDANNDETGYILVPIAVRGAGYEAEWASNMKLGVGIERDGEAQGFSEAADQVMAEIEKYLDDHNLGAKLQEGKIKFWIAGYSRAGATSNLTAKRLVENYACNEAGKRNEVFAYCIEAPQGGTDKAEKLSDSFYYCIHNVINFADIVPLVGPTEMGFKRYGVDHYVPGTAAGSVRGIHSTPSGAGSSGVTDVTEHADNKEIRTKNDEGDNPEYVSLRNRMLKQLYAVDSKIVFDDYFHLMEMNFVPGVSIEEQGDYNESEEWFIRSFLKNFQKASITSRDVWADERVVINGMTFNTIQQALRETCALVFGMDDDKMQGFVNKASRLMSTIRTVPIYSYEYGLIEIWDDVIGDWHTLSGSTKQSYLDFLWGRLVSTSAFDYLDQEDVDRLKVNFPTIAERLLNFLDWDYSHTHISCPDTSCMIWLGTLAGNISRIMMNHYQEVSFAWFRSFDSFYNGEVFDERNQEYQIAKPESIEAPQASADGEEPLALPVSYTNWTPLQGNRQTVTLDVEALEGEMIYYTLNNSDWQLYRNPIELAIPEGEAFASYEIRTRARWYDCDSSRASYRVRLIGEQHPVRVHTKTAGADGIEEKTETLLHAVGETVTLAAEVPSDMFFRRWIIVNGSGHNVTNRLIPDSEQQKQPEVSFVMPEPSGSNFELDYELICYAKYGDVIRTIDLASQPAFDAEALLPTAGEKLPERVEATWNGTQKSYGIEWSFDFEDSHILSEDGEKALNHTVYTAVIVIPEREDMRFTDDVSASLTNVAAENIRNLAVVKKNGSVEITITFAETDDAGDEYEPDPESFSSLCRIVLNFRNLNRDAAAAEPQEYLLAKGRSIELHAPELANMKFISWTADWNAISDQGISMQQTDSGDIRLDVSPSAEADTVEIGVDYKPVISRVEIVLGDEDWVPVAGNSAENAPVLQSVTVTSGRRYQFVPDENGRFGCFQTSLTPGGIRIYVDGIRHVVYNYDTVYEAKVLYLGTPSKEVSVIPEGGGEAFNVSSLYVMAEDAEILINGLSAELQGDGTAVLAFPKTEPGPVNLLEYEKPADISGVPHATSRDELKYHYLPEKTAVTVSDGSISEVNIYWGDIEPDPDDGSLDEIVCTAQGELNLPYGVYANGIDTAFAINVTVNAADEAAAPTASVSSGTYLSAFDVTLSSATKNAKIYYTMDGSDPFENGSLYGGEAIHLSPDMGECVIRARAKKNGCFDSRESIYTYLFTNQVELPEGGTLTYNGELQKGLSASPYYTLTAAEGSGVTIDENGNAMAKEAGTYTVNAHISDDYIWKVGETEPVAAPGEPDEDGTITIIWTSEDITTAEDQEITFTIEKASLANAVVTAEDMAFTGQPLTPEVTVRLGGLIIPAEEYTVAYAGNTEPGTAAITVTGNEKNFTGTAEGTFTIIGESEPEFKAQTMVLSGLIGVTFYMELPEREGFDYSDSYMTFEIEHGTCTPQAGYAEAVHNGTYGYTGFICYINAIQMAEPIRAVYHYRQDGEWKQIEKTAAAADYFTVFDDLVEKGRIMDEKAISLVHALADYGHYVQPFLSAARHWELGKDYLEQGTSYTTDYDYEVIQQAVAEKAPSWENRTEGDIESVMNSLVLDSGTAIRVYFFTSSDYNGTFQAAVDDREMKTYTEQSKSTYYVDISNVAAHLLSQDHTIEAVTADGHTATVTVSGMSYVHSGLQYYTDANDADGTARKAIASIYAYAKAAEDYKAAHPDN